MENTTGDKLFIRRSRSDPPNRVQPIINTTTMAKTQATQVAAMNAHAVAGVDDISSPTSDSNQTKNAVSKKKVSTKKSTKTTKGGKKSVPEKRKTRSSKSIPSPKKAKHHSPTPVL